MNMKIADKLRDVVNSIRYSGSIEFGKGEGYNVEADGSLKTDSAYISSSCLQNVEVMNCSLNVYNTEISSWPSENSEK